jgi:hypothetical protein
MTVLLSSYCQRRFVALESINSNDCLIQSQSSIDLIQGVDFSYLGISQTNKNTGVGDAQERYCDRINPLLNSFFSDSSEQLLIPKFESTSQITDVCDPLTGKTALEPLSGDLNDGGIVFIDPNVTDYQNLLTDIKTSEAIVLDSNRDGIEQITEILAQRSHISNIHIVSHAQEANIFLGTTNLNANTLNTYANNLNDWSKALTSEADILF